MTKINNCPFCGSAVEPGSEFCQNCGAALTSSDEPSSNVTILGSSEYPQPQQQDYYRPSQPQQAHPPPQQYTQPVYYQTPTSTVYVPQQREDSLAQVSLVMAILSCTGILPIIGSIIAIITGHISRSRSKGQSSLVGLILGYIGLGITVIALFFIFMPFWFWY